MVNSHLLTVAGVAAALLVTTGTTNAQTFTFERSFPVGAETTLDVTTERGKITVRAGTGTEVVVVGRVTARTGWNVPTDAVALAQASAGQPPVEQSGHTITLGRPADDRTRSAVRIEYEVLMPAQVTVSTSSNSGATLIDGIRGAVTVHTQSGAITLSNLGETHVETGSGSVTIDGAGPTSVTTSSSGITARQISGMLFIRTQSGGVNATLTGEGDVDIETGSSTVTIDGLDGGLVASTQSGKVTVSGNPRRPWTVTTGSSSIEANITANAMFDLEATSGSGSVKTENLMVRGETDKRRIAGSIDGGGPSLRLSSRSGSITIRSAGGPSR